MTPTHTTLADLFQAGGGIKGPAWMPIYDLGVYVAAADRETGWASDVMAARQLQALQLAECQAIVDLCAAFQAGAICMR